ncbi:EAL-associated domain-containing protein [Gracilibacillus sp. YIM 98692]|uniref:EAL domain-containing protein n=1 Tax=Gracilibacillus sp. YIM 98692 TaxID=2663532 RepID=UPI0013D84913|nr:EAL-associated domain-containing protein [Gracilibacillus sp. YIM 98692]
MDPLDVMLYKDKVKAYFEPVLSADSHEVTGYQTVAVMEKGEKVENIQFFFQDPNVPDDFKQELDQHVYYHALKQCLEQPQDTSLFLTVHATNIVKESDNAIIPQLLRFQEKGLNLSQIIIAVAELDKSIDDHVFWNSLKYLKALGTKIAIHDVDSGSNQFSRISKLEPNIIIIDLQSLQNPSLSSMHHNVIYSLTLLARKVGAEILYKGIDSNYPFHYAWRKNGRYYQGTLFAQAMPSFVDKNRWKDSIKGDIQQFIQIERSKLEEIFQFTANINETMSNLTKSWKKNSDLDKQLLEIAGKISNIAFRLYLTDEDGFQKTSNIVLNTNGKWELDTSALEKNWSWRPYFIENVIRMNKEKVGFLSDLYSDIETGELIRTFSYPVNQDLYLFMDISRMYIDEHEYLLW